MIGLLLGILYGFGAATAMAIVVHDLTDPTGSVLKPILLRAPRWKRVWIFVTFLAGWPLWLGIALVGEVQHYRRLRR